MWDPGPGSSDILNSATHTSLFSQAEASERDVCRELWRSLRGFDHERDVRIDS